MLDLLLGLVTSGMMAHVNTYVFWEHSHRAWGQFLSAGHLKSLGPAAASLEYRFRFIAYLIASFTIYGHPPSSGQGLYDRGRH
jgi:hypothetical protein